MTDRLSALLHEEVDRLDVPTPPVRETLTAGRRIRRRRRLTEVVGVVAVVAVVGVGAAALNDPDSTRPSDDVVADTTPAGEPVDLGPVFAVGDTVYLDSGQTEVQLPEVAQALYYTSAGLLVRTNADGSSDGGAPFHFQLVTADGTATPLDLTLGEVVPSTDPTQPYVAYAETTEAGVDVVVRDVSTDKEVARVNVPGVDWSGGWEGPPVALAGDRVYVSGNTTTTVLDWRTGETDSTDVVDPLWPQAGGRAMRLAGNGTLEILDVASGETLVSVPGMEAPWGGISPDGRWALVHDQMEIQNPSFDVYEVDQGTHVTIDAEAWQFGWTAGGDLYSVDKSGLRECDTRTGECVDTPLPGGVIQDGALVRVGGRTYES